MNDANPRSRAQVKKKNNERVRLQLALKRWHEGVSMAGVTNAAS